MSGVEGAVQRSEGRFGEAAKWLTRLRDSTEMSRAELQSWQAFIASPKNHEAFGSLQRIANVLTGISRPALPSWEEVGQDTYDGAVSVQLWREQQALKAKQIIKLWRPGWLTGWLVGVATAGLGALLILGAWFSVHVWLSSKPQTYQTAAAEHLIVSLKDGSKITLGAKTKLHVQFTAGQRQIHLHRGEAIFSVAHNAKYPFVVFAGSGSVTAVGTEFNVWRDLDRTTITVTEGAVDVRPLSAAQTLSAAATAPTRAARVEKGEEVSYQEGGHSSAVTAADVSAATAWREGRFVYRHTPLKYVISDVNRYFRDQLVLGDSAAGELQFSGAVPQSLTAGEFARALQSIFQLEATEAKGRIVIRMRAPDPNKQSAVKL